MEMHGRLTTANSLIRRFQLIISTAPSRLLEAYILEYSPSEGGRLELLLEMFFDKMAADIQQKGKPVAGVNGNFRLELCLSDDHQFCGLQLFRFGDFKYNPVFEPRFYEGKDAETIAQLI